MDFGDLATEEESLAAVSEREMWLNNTTNDVHDHDDDDLLGMNMNMNDDDASMLYCDFPPLPDFPCMSSTSSSSSSSSTPLKTIACTSTTSNTTTSSSSSASSSSVPHDNQGCFNFNMHDPLTTLSSTASMEISHQEQQDLVVGDCMEDVMDTFGYMELLEANEFFDPLVDFTQEQHDQQIQVQDEQYQQVPNQANIVEEENRSSNARLCAFTQECPTTDDNNNNNDVFVCDGATNDEMSMVFLEWLKCNKDSVSANDLRNVKLKKSTIESAAKRLGGGKEGMKQLLKLILEWVQTSHLQNKRNKENNTTLNLVPQKQQFQDPMQNMIAPDQSIANTCFNQTSWLDQTQTQTQTQPLIVPQHQFSQAMNVGVGFVGDPYTNGSVSNNIMNPFQHGGGTNEYHNMLESNQSWGASQFDVAASNYNQSFGDNNNVLQHGVSFGGYGNQYNSYQFFQGSGDRLMRLGPSATKEARKKRMARQRRFMSHHRHNHNQNQGSDSLARLSSGGGDSCANVVAAGSHANPANWMYWQSMAGGGATSLAPVVPVEAMQTPVERSTVQAHNCQQGGRSVTERRQGWKPEKNLRFLLQKVLKQSDVGSLGRIVLPKKEAETHLPELEARDGISITMEDIGTSRVWNMRYRYWPNNKSRMYLLENTGDFVKANGLQEGDFIVIYSDVKCGKFMIRGVKVRQQQGTKPEAKKAGKSHKNQHGNNASNSTGAVAMDNNGTPKRKK